MIFYMKGFTIYLLYCQTTQGFQADMMVVVVVVVWGGGGRSLLIEFCAAI
jgi:hypothetical protein